MLAIEATKVADGLGFGDGAISAQARNDVTTKERQDVEKLINSPDILVPIDRDKSGRVLDDDGCGDGRPVARVFEGAIRHSQSLNRPKVFGGGPAMAAAMLIGLGRARGQQLKELFVQAMAELKRSLVNFGGHTDTHAQAPNCGCGAIDKAPHIIANAVRFEADIRSSIARLGVDTDGLDEVFRHYRSYVAEFSDQSYAGQEVMEAIRSSKAVIKELDGDHREMYIILNTKASYTINQQLVRQVSGGKIQAFAVDVWRLRALAQRLYPIAANASVKAQQEQSARQKQAALSELVYTLAVAGTLTDGDLPVYAINEVPESIRATVLSD